MESSSLLVSYQREPEEPELRPPPGIFLPSSPAIDWSEPWFRYLGAFHILCVILTVQTRNRGTIQALYFGVMLLLVYSAEFLNGWAAQNYGLFSQQQYFDSNGMFISLVFSVPILVNCLVIVIMWLWSVGNLIADVKRLKYRRAAVMHARAERAKNQ